jgi:hypothetical protein
MRFWLVWGPERLNDLFTCRLWVSPACDSCLSRDRCGLEDVDSGLLKHGSLMEGCGSYASESKMILTACLNVCLVGHRPSYRGAAHQLLRPDRCADRCRCALRPTCLSVGRFISASRGPSLASWSSLIPFDSWLSRTFGGTLLHPSSRCCHRSIDETLWPARIPGWPIIRRRRV